MTNSLLAAAVSCAVMAASMANAVAQITNADQARQYRTCMALARSEPRRGIDMANGWEKNGGDAGARHCRAIALFQLGEHAEAGRQLEALARTASTLSDALRAEIFAQAGQAYQAAQLGPRALAAQNAAIALDPGNVEIWIDRSITHAAAGDFRAAVSDLTRALTLAPARADALVLRAAAWRRLDDPRAAAADAEAALRVRSDDPEALLERGLARRALGDKSGGDVDLRRVLTLVPAGSDTAARAHAALQAPSGATPQPAHKAK
ncbi:MAG: tetratricopeptide repeat protein [Alphaproteobacteria bacterium]|nr:tetratricopeptide repeat protein [Alphaproteobacteria bacterium]